MCNDFDVKNELINLKEKYENSLQVQEEYTIMNNNFQENMNNFLKEKELPCLFKGLKDGEIILLPNKISLEVLDRIRNVFDCVDVKVINFNYCKIIFDEEA